MLTTVVQVLLLQLLVTLKYFLSPFDLNDPSASAEASESSHATYVPLAIPCHYYYAM